MGERDLDSEIEELEARLQTLRNERHGASPPYYRGDSEQAMMPSTAGAFHSTLLLSDSALPLGSFAFSSGLESFLAHEPQHPHSRGLPRFQRFLSLSVTSLKSTAIPYLRAAFCEPRDLARLDNDFDASTTCKVAKRASVAQGKALVALWDRSLKCASPNVSSMSLPPNVADAITELNACSHAVKIALVASLRKDQEAQTEARNCHLAPLFGALCAALSLSLESTLYLFLLNHAKTLSSAAIRASLLGPYQAQSVLAGE